MADSAIQLKYGFRKPPPANPRTGSTVQCSVCHEPHYRKKSQLAPKGNRFYCSRECRRAESAKVELTCETCGTGYVRFRSQGKRGSKCFCSRECQAKYGLSSVRCSWPDCSEMVPCRLMRGTGRNGVDEFKVDLVRHGEYTRFPFCPQHTETIGKYLGAGSRATKGRARLLSDPEHEYEARSLSSRFTRMILFERANCKCQSCGVLLDWKGSLGAWQVDHVIPMFKGGKTKLSNLQVLCSACHDAKTSPEKSEATRERHALTKIGRWLTHHHKDALIARLRARLVALGEPDD